MISSFEQAALRCVAGHPKASAIAKTFAVVHGLVERENWQGACHATTAVTFVLLAAQGIESCPCLGEVIAEFGAFDHSWIEIDGRLFDVAISHTLIPEMSSAPVIAGRRIDDGLPTPMTYGANSGHPPMGPAALLATMPIGEYMDGFPGHHRLGLWGLASELAKELSLSLSPEDLRSRYADTRWVQRP